MPKKSEIQATHSNLHLPNSETIKRELTFSQVGVKVRIQIFSSPILAAQAITELNLTLYPHPSLHIVRKLIRAVPGVCCSKPPNLLTLSLPPAPTSQDLIHTLKDHKREKSQEQQYEQELVHLRTAGQCNQVAGAGKHCAQDGRRQSALCG